MASDLLIWWLITSLIGLAGLPLANWLLRALPDGGFSLARPLGLLLTGYLAWLLAMFGLAPFIAPVVGFAAVGVAALGGPRAALAAAQAALRARWRSVLAAEALFLGALLAAVWLRAHDPTPWGTERPMDFAFFNAIRRSGMFPPADPWLSGFSINYYYFGYLLMATAAQLAALEPAVAYNLSLALIFAMTAQAVGGMIANLIALAACDAPLCQQGWRRWSVPFFALLGVIFVLVAGNQSGALQVLLGDERVVALDGRQALAATRQALSGAATISLPYPAVTGEFGTISGWERRDKVADFNWWWPSRSLWDAQRPGEERRYTITEFPFFSFRLGDMHPHVMALPFGMLAAALALAVLARPEPPAPGQGRRGWGELVLTGIAIGSLYAMNSWDLPTYLLLYAAALTLRVFASDAPRPWRAAGWMLVLVIGAAYVLFLPFHLTFRSLVGSAPPLIDLPLIGRLTSVIAPFLGSRTGLHAFIVIFGLFAAPIIVFVYLIALRPATSEAPVTAPAHASSASLTSHVGIAALTRPSTSRLLLWLPPALLLAGLLGGFPLLALAGLGMLALALARELVRQAAQSFALLLAALGCAVLLGVELVYIRDVFEGFSARMNTVFKFYYQIWLLWGALAPFCLWWLLARAEGRARLAGWGAAALALALLGGALVYPWLTVREYARGSIEGLAGRTPRELSPAGAASLAWLRREAPPGSVVLEAVAVEDRAAQRCGGSYNAEGYGGVAAATGIPTVLGWVGHQIQWRGGDPEARAELAPRCAAVDMIYLTGDPSEAERLLRQYGVDFVYIGALERRLYPPESLAKFARLGAVVFEQDEVTIYQLTPAAP
ncbi:MAG: DUF2298 domain-containing protein [Chloroflexaceae bacterium]|nr:DUF2298 domain-containing protein [Chloroflexaceae bacterium]